MSFTPFSSFLEASFFQTLAAKKLNEYKLDDSPQKVVAEYTWQQGRLVFDGGSFSASKSTTNGAVTCPGTLLNFNTIEEFKGVDKKALLAQWGDQMVLQAIKDGSVFQSPEILNSFLLTTFCDLKKYVFTYWMAVPCLNTKWDLHEVADEGYHSNLATRIPELGESFVIIDPDDNITPFSELEHVDRSEGATVAFLSPTLPETTPWTVRNICLLLHVLGFKTGTIISVGREKNRILEWKRGSEEMGTWTGWEKNLAGKLLPKQTNLGPLLNPLQLASQAVDLNLKLMKWRIAPELDLDTIKHTKCLLLGAGTLGSYVSRSLLAWGVEQVTFVDNGSVSFSNPVRQPLYKYVDCLDGGKPKAETASEALKEIYPAVKTSGVTLEVPMIGHSTTSTSEERVHQQYDDLVALIESHDAVFLLMDSRESRWLPTVICSALKKTCITAAIGFDSFVVMRHGVEGVNDLGCYFCNDVVAPTDSMNDRTLDQQCTVTRPGIAPIVSGYGVEILQALCQDEASAPHQLRGFLHDFSTVKITGQRFKCCSACSPVVVEEWKNKRWEFVKRALNEKGWVEELCGLAELQRGVDELDFGEGEGSEEEWEM
ncbi:Ubiquitin-like modifier-activating enzyme ATG7 [Yarrowia sp. C11]|nr:Ubiquitin-like modifier-activating enzyme ATG7 [Yarrowia sp. E02]KAG5365251.1 Ubiquitin-like modifier-activating enzyme ATG7 [Yarrowia sp. C11]